MNLEFITFGRSDISLSNYQNNTQNTKFKVSSLSSFLRTGVLCGDYVIIVNNKNYPLGVDIEKLERAMIDYGSDVFICTSLLKVESNALEDELAFSELTSYWPIFISKKLFKTAISEIAKSISLEALNEGGGTLLIELASLLLAKECKILPICTVKKQFGARLSIHDLIIARNLINRYKSVVRENILVEYRLIQEYINNPLIRIDETNYKQISGIFNKSLLDEWLVFNDLDVACKIALKVRKHLLVRNIAIVVGSLGGGGAERCAVSLGSIFKKNGYGVAFINSYESHSPYPRDEEIPVVTIKENHLRRVKLERYLKKHNIDTIIEMDHIMDCSVREALWLVLNGYNVIVQEHSQFFLPLFFNRNLSFFKLRNAVFKCISALTCLSEMDKYLWQKTGVERTFNIHNPLSFLEEKLSNGISTSHEVTFMMRMAPEKGLWIIPEVLRLVLDQEPEAKFNLCGFFPNVNDCEQFKKKLKKLDLEQAVLKFGYDKNPKVTLSNSRVFVCISPVEGSPMSIAEARMFGVPTVMFALSYIELSQHGCVSVAHGDVHSMADEIVKLLKDKSYWNRISKDCRVGLSAWSSRTIIQEWQKLFDIVSQPAITKASENKDISSLALSEMIRSLDYYGNWYQGGTASVNLDCSPNIELDIISNASKYIAIKKKIFAIAPLGSRRYKLLKFLYRSFFKNLN